MIPDMNPGASKDTAYDPSDILADGDVVTREVTLASGQNVVRGAVLGKVTSGGAYKLSAVGAGDGSETPTVIAAQAVNASGGAKKIQVYVRCKVRPSKLTFGASHTAASTWEALAARGINLVSEQLY